MDNLPQIRVLGFKTKYAKLPVKGDPTTEKCDLKGYKLDASDRRVLELQAEDYVTFAPAHSPINTAITERIRFLIPDPDRVGNDDDGVKLAFMNARWAQIAPAYEAFKAGREIPINGTPLGAWPGISPEQAEVLRQSGLRTVEDVATITEGQTDRIRLPNVRDLREQAKLFLENTKASDLAEREAQKDATIAEMAERIAAMEALLEERTNPDEKPRRVRQPKAEEAA